MAGHREGMTTADQNLFHGAFRADPEAVAAALRDGAQAARIDLDGATALHALPHAGWPSAPRLPIDIQRLERVAQILVEAGAPPNAINRFGMTALGVAASRSDPDLAAILLGMGCDPTGALFGVLATAAGADPAAILLRLGADPLAVDAQGRAPMSFATDTWSGQRDDALAALLESAILGVLAPAARPGVARPRI